MSYILKGLLALGKLLAKSSRLLPAGISAIFVLVTFFIDAFKVSLPFAFKNLSLSLLAAEYQINKAVTLAIQDSPQYNFSAFLSIITSVFIIYYFVKWVGKTIVGTGHQARIAAYGIALVIMGIIEIATVKIVDGVFGFYPIYSGVWFLLVNLGPVLTNIHFF